MKKLILADLAQNWRNWGALAVLFAAVAAGLSFGVALVEYPFQKYGAEARFDSAAGIVAAMTFLASTVVVSSISSLFFAQRIKDFALWQLVGVQPKQISRTVTVQAVLVSLVAAIVGTVLALPFLPAFFNLTFKSDSLLTPGLMTLIVTPILVTLVAWIGSKKSARASSEISPLLLFRDSAPKQKANHRGRWIFASISAFLAACAAVILWTDARSTGGMVIFLLISLTAVVAALAPIVVPPVLNAWTGVVPRDLSPAWALARNQAQQKVNTSGAVLVPLLVMIAILAGTISTAAIYQTANPGEAPMGLLDLLSFVGGVIVSTLVGSTIAIFISSRARLKELALLEASGATQRQLIYVSVFQALMFIVTAIILALLPILLSALTLFMAYSLQGIQASFIIDVGAIVLPALVGFALVCAAMLIPTVSALKKPLASALS